MKLSVFVHRQLTLSRAFARLLAISLVTPVIVLSASVVFAASTPADYAGRLTQAEQMVDELIEGEPSSGQVITVVTTIRQLLPLHEDVEVNGQFIRTNNAWLHDAIEQVVKNANGDEEQLRSMLVEIADRLYLLEQRVSALQPQTNTPATTATNQHAELERILARPEYLPEEKKESTVQKWTNKLRDKLIELLARLFGGGRTSGGNLGAGTVSIFRIVITLVLLAAASLGLVKLLRRLHGRRKKEKDDESREVLGEELADDVTAAELLTNANELARQGDFRSAIRRAYIALLCEMEQRGKVHLHRAKTNRDYLDELKPEKTVYPTFSVLTGAFEHVWYGQEPATESEFNDFITLYQETVR